MVEMTEIGPGGAFGRALNVLPRTPINREQEPSRAPKAPARDLSEFGAGRRVRGAPAFAEACASAWEAMAGRPGMRRGPPPYLGGYGGGQVRPIQSNSNQLKPIQTKKRQCGSTGDSPVPSGDPARTAGSSCVVPSPDGTEATPRSNRNRPFAKKAAGSRSAVPARFGDVKLCKAM